MTPFKAPATDSSGNPDFVPATVHYGDPGTRSAVVWHPLGDKHENARLTVARLKARGVRVVTRTQNNPLSPRTILAPPSFQESTP